MVCPLCPHSSLPLGGLVGRQNVTRVGFFSVALLDVGGNQLPAIQQLGKPRLEVSIMQCREVSDNCSGLALLELCRRLQDSLLGVVQLLRQLLRSILLLLAFPLFAGLSRARQPVSVPRPPTAGRPDRITALRERSRNVGNRAPTGRQCSGQSCVRPHCRGRISPAASENHHWPATSAVPAWLRSSSSPGA